MKTIVDDKGNIKATIYADTLEDTALEQIKKLAFSNVYKDSKVVIMPDAHAGKGCTIGTTMTIKDKITPNLVGVDIGCGMLTITLDNDIIDLRKLDDVINTFIPAGFNVHETPYTDSETIEFFDKVQTNLKCINHIDLDRCKLSLGTLGGGNHFIELGFDELLKKHVLIIHTGSRKLGVDVCKYYQGIADNNNTNLNNIINNTINKYRLENRHSEINTEIKRIKNEYTYVNNDFTYLIGNDFDNYINDMHIVQEYASNNRSIIAEIIIDKMGFIVIDAFETVHNYIDFKRMMLRKGAVSSEKGEQLLIPINMRDGSLLCIGKGNPEWNYSAPHGAGRLYSRNEAKKQITLKEFKDTMLSVYSTSVNENTIDEAPQSYKNINEIKKLIVDTCDIVTTIKPVYNFKSH